MVTYHYGGIIRGTTAERTGGTWTNLPLGTLFIEGDTEDIFEWQSGSIWRQKGGKPLSSAAQNSYTIYLTSATVKARNNRTSLIDYSGDNDTTATAGVFNNAINNIQNLSDLSVARGGSVFIMAGHYKLQNTVEMDWRSTKANKHGIALIGEGSGTVLNWTPTSTLTDGLYIRMKAPVVKNMALWGNANTVHLMSAATGVDGIEPMQLSDGTIEGIEFHGANQNVLSDLNGNGSQIPIPGQIGFFCDAPGANKDTIFWKFSNCIFNCLDYGMYTPGQKFNAMQMVNCIFQNNRIGADFDNGVQHNISNIRIEGGDNEGDIGFHFGNPSGGGAGLHCLSNINIELHVDQSKGLVFEDNSVNNVIGPEIITFGAGGADIGRFNVVAHPDRRTNIDLLRDMTLRPFVNAREIGYTSGAVQAIDIGGTKYNNGFGIMAPPNVRENGAGVGTSLFLSTDFGSGVVRQLSTGTTSNTPMSIQFVRAWYQRTSEMRLRVKFDFHFSAVTAMRAFIGFIRPDDVGGTDIFAVPGASSDILDSRVGFGLWVDTPTSTQWKVMHNDGTAGASVQDAITGNPTVEGAGAVHYADIITRDAFNTFVVYYDQIRTLVTTRIPASSHRYGWVCWIQNTTGIDRRLNLHYIDMETNR